MLSKYLPAKRLLEFIDQEAVYPRKKLISFSAISGITNGLLLGVINHGAGMVGEFSAAGYLQFYYLMLFAALLSLLIYTKRYTLEKAAVLVEEVLYKVRIRIADKIRHTELSFVEATGHSEIYNSLAQDTVQISQSATVVFASIQAAIMLIFTMVYVAWLTLTGFMLTVTAIGLGAWVFMLKRERIMNDLQSATEQEIHFFDALNDTLSGFKEIKLNRIKSHDLFEHQDQIATDVKTLKSRAGINSVFVMMFSEIFFYILIATILFIWPFFNGTDPGTIIKLTASILFIMGPLNLLFGSFPLFIKADVAVNNLRELEQKVDTASQGFQLGEPPEHKPFTFERIHFQDVRFQYVDKEGAAQFKVGPVNLDLRFGETVFIVGGNGSGKSTLLKLLTGLYYPVSGEITINGELLDQDLYADYRELFAIVFTDFHLFDRLYGIQDIDSSKVNALIKEMGLAGKTRFKNGAFTNTALSTGQRKRLAYINTVLEDKQIYIFDELAADQDPGFRKRFYEVLLPGLKEQGKTIIAVTHDDKYFATADRVLKMDEGQLSENGVKGN
ncbi:cyclic peptide export ABC transporter [Thalassomonas actiniarum]|uniref:Cyclic peptide export ABC transporter n=1 Tax=Thalassomonas actiniarum TaxID=485447 RepID=A0AAE9YY73_9GAMM|nr:cyclic peptide export ABC transporter [Thalassomonas actiniarum]WDE02539.1 cyclic peptide export ABC transporter [Thalassomonas actiniarum]